MPSNTRPIYVCMLPRENPTNEGLGLMSDALEKTGHVKIANYRYIASLFSRADLFHVHWPDELLAGVRWPKHLIKVYLFLAYTVLCKILKRPIIWTVHNVGAYEGNYPILEKILWRVFLPRVNWTIHLCPASIEAIHCLTPNPPPGSVIPHSHYRSVYRAPVPAVDVRGPFTFTSFGFIRPYKGFERLIQNFRDCDIEGAVLRISGAPSFKESSQIVSELLNLSGGDQRIILDLRTLSRREIEELVSRSDVIVLPYHKIMNSGVANVALSLGRPIMGPAAGCILDYHQRLGSEWVFMYENELTTQDLKKAYERFRGRRPATLPDLSWMEPDRVAAKILDVYQRVLEQADHASEFTSG